jgi:hypothetical protein
MELLANCKPFGIGSMPNQTGKEAWELILEHFPQIPFWPQLPKRIFLENMYAQFSEHLPGLEVEMDKERFYIITARDIQPDMEAFFNDYLSDDPEKFSISEDHCHGLYSGLELFSSRPERFSNMEFVKGQITGPVSFGLQVTDQDKLPILYNDMMHDIMVKNLQMKAVWQERMLQKITKNTIISVDEPYLSSLGSGVFSLNRNQVVDDIELVFGKLTGLKAMHCCGNTDWSIITETSLDILLFDAYDYLDNILLFPGDIKTFLDRGGTLGWGIVPTNEQALKSLTLQQLIDHFESGIKKLEEKGISREAVLHQSLITPACGLGNLSAGAAMVAMELTSKLSMHVQDKYGLV